MKNLRKLSKTNDDVIRGLDLGFNYSQYPGENIIGFTGPYTLTFMVVNMFLVSNDDMSYNVQSLNCGIREWSTWGGKG